MTTAKKKTTTPTPITPTARFKWFEYVEEDADEGEVPYRIRRRTNLSYGELEQLKDELEGKTSDRELWPVFAPFIVEWNITGIASDGKEVPIPAPAEGGAEQFEFTPPALFGAIYRDMVMRPTLPLAMKRPQPFGPTPEPVNGAA